MLMVKENFLRSDIKNGNGWPNDYGSRESYMLNCTKMIMCSCWAGTVKIYEEFRELWQYSVIERYIESGLSDLKKKKKKTPPRYIMLFVSINMISVILKSWSSDHNDVPIYWISSDVPALQSWIPTSIYLLLDCAAIYWR